MKNLTQMMKQAQAMQAKMQEMQATLERTEVTGVSGGGMVTVTVSGKGEMRRIKIDPKLVDPGDVAMLEDLVVAAVNEGIRSAQRLVADEMGKVTGGLGIKLPGMP